jgi:hypothetical protein
MEDRDPTPIRDWARMARRSWRTGAREALKAIGVLALYAVVFLGVGWLPWAHAGGAVLAVALIATFPGTGLIEWRRRRHATRQSAEARLRAEVGLLDGRLPVPVQVERDEPAWRSVVRSPARHPIELATVVAAALAVASYYHALPWQADGDVVFLGVLAVYGVAFVFWKWLQEERGFRSARRQRAD